MQFIRRFSELSIDDVPLVGGKNASLGEMYSALTERGVRVPNGFATTAEAYWHFIRHNNLEARINEALDELDANDVEALARTGISIRNMINHGEMPPDLEEEIRQAYAELCEEYGANTDVAVRSSATAEDLPTASFAGQQETYLNNRGDKNLISTCKRVFASLFTNRAISYRVHQGFAHRDVALSIGVQKMVRSDLASAGVMFTLDTESGFRDVILITGAYGLGENVVQGAVNPDEFYVFKPTLTAGKRPILKRQLGDKAIRMIYTGDNLAGASTKNVDVKRDDRERFCLNDEEVLTLARYGVIIEEHYSRLAGEPRPMDIEWAKDGKTGELFIVQARPETVQSQLDAAYQVIFHLKETGKILVQGKSVGQRIAAGPARVVVDASEMKNVRDGEILVTDMTDPDWEPVMKRAGAIVTNRGGRTCHAAIVARELGIPAIVGCGDATLRIRDGQEVTVSCAEGDTGNVYDGRLEFESRKIDLRRLEKPKTRLMLNVGNPEQAFKFANLPCEGVGLARLEFIINNSIRVHPRALLEYDTLDADTREQIDRASAGYPDRRSFYVERLAEGIGSIAAAFYPRPVIVRMSDFKSNEYASLIGGTTFEPEEENPMIGFRGASRYDSESFAASFAMECEAIRNVRETKGLDNVAVMIPFTRSVDEARRVLEIMAKAGLKRGQDGLRIYLMCEIPANALLADDFLEHFDGFSIGSNDLTQLTLGVDRDSGLLSGFDERNPAVLKLMEMAIAACNAREKYVGICGQAPSDFPEITRWLVEQGIQSISLNPDSLLTMINTVLETERELNRA
jgi:pyruvate,water dikinase